VLHSRVIQNKPRVIAAKQDQPTRSRLLVNAAISAAKSGADCTYCGNGAASDFRVGYTFRDRWVLGIRAANWSGDPSGLQSIQLRQGFLEWYPHPDPGRFKWFVNTAVGNMNVDVYSEKSLESSDRYVGKGLPSMAFGSGVDVSVVRRFVVTPFISYNRNLSGYVDQTHCVTHIPTGSTNFETDCVTLGARPHTFTLLQLGTRVGWR
jgi:hypothetical protein